MAAEYRRIEIADVGYALTLLADVYTDARRALAEYVSNSADAFRLAEREGIWRNWTCEVRIEEDKGRIIISDNATGIHYERLLEIPSKVTLSYKRGDLEAKGHKAIGLLAFASFCNRMRIITRAEATRETYYAEWSQESLRNPETCPVVIDREIRDPRRSPGTDVYLEGLFQEKRHQLKKQKVIDFLKAEFAPDIREKRYELFVVEGESRTKVEPGRYSGVPFYVLQVETVEGEKINLDLYLSQKPGFQRVSLFIRGKQVIENLASHPDFDHPPWTSGQVAGEVRCDFLRPITGRAGGVESGAEWARFVHALRTLESRICEVIERITEEQKARQAHRIFKELNQALSYVLPELNWDELPKSVVGRNEISEVPQKGDNGIGIGELGTESEIKIEAQPKDPRKSRLIDPSRVRPARTGRAPAFNWREVEFEPEAMDLRSRFVPSAAMIEINSAHKDYLIEREEEIAHRNYLIRLAAKELTLMNFREMGDIEVTERMVQLETALTRYFRGKPSRHA